MSPRSRPQVVGVLRSQLAQLDEVKKEREQLENDIKSAQFDMTSRFLTALAQDNAINEEALSVTELDNIYGGYTQKVQQSLKTQEDILGNVQVGLSRTVTNVSSLCQFCHYLDIMGIEFLKCLLTTP